MQRLGDYPRQASVSCVVCARERANARRPKKSRRRKKRGGRRNTASVWVIHGDKPEKMSFFLAKNWKVGSK